MPKPESFADILIICLSRQTVIIRAQFFFPKFQFSSKKVTRFFVDFQVSRPVQVGYPNARFSKYSVDHGVGWPSGPLAKRSIAKRSGGQSVVWRSVDKRLVNYLFFVWQIKDFFNYYYYSSGRSRELLTAVNRLLGLLSETSLPT